MDKKIEGGCLCGKSRFQVNNDPDATIVCHCRYCQLRTGSAFGNIAYFKKLYFKLLSGDLKTFEFITESGRNWINYFCKNCATTVYCCLEIRKDHIGIPVGLIDPPTFNYKISKEVFTRSKANFVKQIECEQTFETNTSYIPIKEDEDRLKG